MDDRMVLYANKLLGAPRLRQIRVRNDSCSIPEDFKDAIKVCYSSYSSSIEDTNDFYPSLTQYTSPDA